MSAAGSAGAAGNPFTDGKFSAANGMALVFEAMAKTDQVNKQKQEVEENPADAQIELAIEEWLQDGLNQTQNSLSALKEKLGYLMQHLGGYDANVMGWVQGLDQEANSYTLPQDLQDLLNTYQTYVTQDLEDISQDEDNVNHCENAVNDLKQKIDDVKNDMKHCKWYNKIKDGLELAGLYTALGACYTGLGICLGVLKLDQDQLKSDEKDLDKYQQAAHADEQNFANVVAHGGQMMAAGAQKTLTGYQADMANLETVFSQSTSESTSLGQTLSEMIQGSHSV